MKTFFRVEHGVDKYLKKYYLGMYSSSVGYHMHGRRHPQVYNDVKLRDQLTVDGDIVIRPEYLFAFPDINTFKEWVYDSDWLEELHRLGYVLSVYECDDGYHGYSQSIFNWEKAQLKHRLNLLEV